MSGMGPYLVLSLFCICYTMIKAFSDLEIFLCITSKSYKHNYMKKLHSFFQTRLYQSWKHQLP